MPVVATVSQAEYVVVLFLPLPLVVTFLLSTRKPLSFPELSLQLRLTLVPNNEAAIPVGGAI